MPKKDDEPELNAETVDIATHEAENIASEEPEIDMVADEEHEPKSTKTAKHTVVLSAVKNHRFTTTLKSLGNKYWAKKKLALPATAIMLIVLILVIPLTRYWSLGLFIKSPVTVQVVDSKTKLPVSSATVTINNKKLKTDANGKAAGTMSLGKSTLSVKKQYYTSNSESITVTFSKAQNTFKISLAAVGRQVPIVVTNKITGKPLANAVIKVAKTEAKTDKNGKATIVLPTTTDSQKAAISFDGYNNSSVTIQVTDKVMAANSFTLTPTGKLYFLSNQSGKIDVVKTNLDGSDRQTVLAGTGNEEPYSTSLLASRDWKYLALQARRDGKVPSVYIIDTSTDKLTTIDEGDVNFTLVGWAGDTFAYYVNRGYPEWQTKNIAIKTYDATTKKLTVVYETSAGGIDIQYYAEKLGWIQQVGNKLLWFTSWTDREPFSVTTFNLIKDRQSQIFEYDTTTNTKKTLKAYSYGDLVRQPSYYFSPYTSYQSVVYKPHEIYFTVNTGDDSNAVAYSEYEDSVINTDSDEANKYFTGSQAAYPTYLESPSGAQTFWTDYRDGKNVLFIGDQKGVNGKQIASLSDYSPYGWYTDDYVVVTKDSSELYIMSSDGKSMPLKISDYYKLSTSYRGYGGGYGGL